MNSALASSEMEISSPPYGFLAYLTRSKAEDPEDPSNSVVFYDPEDGEVFRKIPGDAEGRAELLKRWNRIARENIADKIKYIGILYEPEIADEEYDNSLPQDADGWKQLCRDVLTASREAMGRRRYEVFAAVIHNGQYKPEDGGYRPLHIHVLMQSVKKDKDN